MLKLTNTVKKLLSCPLVVLGGITLISIFSLASAFTAEIAFGLEPCPLCVYQRIPFVIIIALGLSGLALRKNKNLTGLFILLSALSFLANSAIALYHTGVERQWWRSAVEGCAVDFGNNNPQTMLENILSAPTARCDEIPWADPLFGLSMANYNVILCFGLFIACLWSFLLLRQHTDLSHAKSA